jgi:hypothetical protein
MSCARSAALRVNSVEWANLELYQRKKTVWNRRRRRGINKSPNYLTKTVQKGR